MANDSVTRVTADASGYRAELDSARKSATAFMQTQDQAAQRVALAQQAIAEAAANGSKASASAINSFVTSLSRAADTAGKTRSQLLEMKAAQLGIADAASSSIAALRAFEQESSASGEAVEGIGVKSAGARREILVMIHEASQGNWKNLAGSVQVFGEKIDLMGKLMSPAGIAMGAVAGIAVGFAYEVAQGVISLNALSKASQTTNGYLGLTTDQLEQMSVAIAGSTHSITSVQAAMTALVSSGQVAADQLALATKVTAEFASDTGESAEKAAQSMIEFAKDPQKALEDLQAQYHTFSAAQVDVIENYLKSGDSASAYTAILKGLDQAHTTFTTNAQANVGLLQKRWEYWEGVIDDVLNKIRTIGTATSDTQKLADATQRVADAQANVAKQASFPNSFGAQSAQKGLDAAKAALATVQAGIDAQQSAARAQAKVAASGDGAVAVNSYLNDPKYATPLQQRTLAIQKENADYAKATKDVDKTSSDFVAAEKRHADNLIEIDKQYANRNGSKAAASAAATAAQQAIQAQLTSLDTVRKQAEDGLKTTLDHIKSLQDQGLITQEVALQKAHDARADELKDELSIYQQQEDIAKGEKNKSAYEKYAADIVAVQQKITENDQQYTDDAAKLAAKRVADLKVYTDALTQQLATQQSAANASLAGLSLGGNDRADFDKQLAIRQDYDKKVADLAKQQTENKIGSDQYASELAATQDYYDKAVAIATKSSADIRAANADWTTGAKRAIADYGDQAANVAASTASTFQDAFRGMEDAFATFVTTGKISFSSLATSVISDIARMQARSAISGLFSYGEGIASSLFSSTPDTTTGVNAFGFHLASGGAVSGPGTSTSDSIPAMLSNGEGVLNARAMQKLGVPGLNALNQGNVHGMLRFATGGYVGAAASAPSSNSGITLAPQIVVQGGSNAAANESNAGDLNKKITAAVRAVVVNERKQGGALWKMQNGIA